MKATSPLLQAIINQNQNQKLEEKTQTLVENAQTQVSQENLETQTIQQSLESDTFEFSQKEEPKKKTLSTRAKTLIAGAVAAAGAAVVAALCISKGKSKKIPTINIQNLDIHKFKNLQATSFTGNVTGKLKNGEDILMEYLDGKLIKSTTTSGDSYIEKLYDGSKIIKKVNGETTEIDLAEIQTNVSKDQKKLKEILYNSTLSSKEVKEEASKINYKSKEQEKKIQELIKTKQNKEIEEFIKAEQKKEASKPVIDHEPKTTKPVDTTNSHISIKNNNLEAVINNLSLSKLQQYGKSGLPLKYPLEEMQEELYGYLNTLSTTAANTIKSKFNIDFQYDPSFGHVLKAIPTLEENAQYSFAEQHVYDILHKFCKKNKIITGDFALDKELNSLIQDIPEFTFLIGKKQNSVHSYSIDIHTLITLKKAIELANKKGFSAEQKEVLKLSVILHDIGKKFHGNALSDTGHAKNSAIIANDILENYNCSTEIKNKVINIVGNHHWFKEYNNGNYDADKVLTLFGEDLDIAKVIAQADLESVNNDFHFIVLNAHSESEYIDAINKEMDSIKPKTVLTKPKITPNAPMLPTGDIPKYTKYALPLGDDKISLQLGNCQERINLNDPELIKYCNELKDGESFGIGCKNSSYSDVKIQIGDYSADKVSNHHIVITKENGILYIESHSNNGTKICKNIPTKINDDPKIASFIEKLRKKSGVVSVSKTYSLPNGTSEEFEVLLHSKTGGSNVGYYVINKTTGDLFYAKEAQGGLQWQAECAATNLYKAAGINVPEVSTFKCTDGTEGLLSKFIPDLKPVYSATPEVYEGFGMDALLANWDVVGMSNDNLLTNGQKIVRIDAGGSFDYHAHQGGNKPFNNIPTELITLINPNINSQTSDIFGKMTREDLLSSLKKVANLSEGKITEILEASECLKYKSRILDRQKFIKLVISQIESTPQGSLDTFNYMQKVFGGALESAIENATSYSEINSIKQSFVIKNETILKKLVDKLAKKEEYLATILPKVVEINEEDLNIILTKAGFVKNALGQMQKTLLQSEKDKMANYYGPSAASAAIKKIEQPLKQEDINNILVMLNSCDGKYIELAQQDMDRFIELYRNIQKTGFFATNSRPIKNNKWEALYNILKAERITTEQHVSIMNYKGSSTHINGALTSVKNGKKKFSDLDLSTQEDINNIQAYINTQIVTEPVTVYRGEGFEVLKSAATPSGKSLYEILTSIDTTDQNALNDLKYMVKSNFITATQERFMSTSLIKGHEFRSGEDVLWTLEVQQGAKGVALEGVNPGNHLSTECEFLLQRDSKIILEDIEYKKGHWNIKAKVTN